MIRRDDMKEGVKYRIRSLISGGLGEGLVWWMNNNEKKVYYYKHPEDGVTECFLSKYTELVVEGSAYVD